MDAPLMYTSSLGVRKGTWTEEEDFLLRKCIQKYGEGKWHLVPARAGLNRCRKSCRLRWLNYLRPHIKRGDFAEDEIDLILRLHKLLGNRWSLIAGRLPGRTANDVKNYWNTHLQRKLTTAPQRSQERKYNNALKITKDTIIRPRPRTFSSIAKTNVSNKSMNTVHKDESDKETVLNICDKIAAAGGGGGGEGVQWWTSLLENGNEIEEENKLLPNLLHEEYSPPLCMQQRQSDGWDFDLSADIDLWNLLN
ncbi:hypothetical protein HAX54_033726 [Datura stramonium]|uniref:Uncharacterized protein n=1 Tax=Datura stramonium TaxID=4076 RepID=A0ABS8SDM6_DATST|nr:hypothetical protein [Datura stramonium]